MGAVCLIPPKPSTPLDRPPAYEALWKEMIETFRRERSLLLAIGGFFMLLPTAMLYAFLPSMPQPAAGDDAFAMMVAYYQQHQPEFIVHALWVTFGELAMTVLLAAPDRPTVGEALVRAVRLYPWHVLQRLVVVLALIGGALMFILPALYFSGRLALCTPLLAVGEGRNPLVLMRRSQELTRGAGWHIAAFVILVWLGTTLFSSAVGTISAAMFKPFGVGGVAHVADALVQGTAMLPGLLLGALLPVVLLRQLKAAQ